MKNIKNENENENQFIIREQEAIKFLIMLYGMEGYGIFWALKEMISSGKYELPFDEKEIFFIAYELRVSEELVASIAKFFKIPENEL